MLHRFVIIFTVSLAAAESPRLDFALGVLAAARGNPTEAAARFENAWLADPLALPLAQRTVARRLAAGDKAAAAKIFRELATQRHDELNTQLLYADFLLEQGGDDATAAQLAMTALEKSLKKHPRHPKIIRRLYSIYQRDDQQALATTLLNRLAPEDPESALLYATLTRQDAAADEAAQRDRLDQHYLLAFTAHPELPTLAREASDHFHDTGRPEKAIEILERHSTAAPSSLDLRTRLGILFLAAEQAQKGESVLKEVLEINPRQWLAHQVLAKFYRSHQQPELARNHAGELLKIRTGSVQEFLTLATEWLAADDPRAARLLLEHAVFKYPDRLELLQKLAIATRRDPETRETAARLFREAEAAKPEAEKSEPAFLVEFAEVLAAQGHGKAAEERLRTAIRAYPADAKKETAAALRRLALLWETENRNPAAAKALRQRADGLDR